MDNPADEEELIARGYTHPVAGSEVPQTRLDEAWRALQLELRRLGAPTVEASIAAGSLTAEDVVDVVCAATLRVLRNEEGIEEDSTSIDDYRESRRRADATQDLYFTAAELRRLTPPTPALDAGSFPYTR